MEVQKFFRKKTWFYFLKLSEGVALLPDWDTYPELDTLPILETISTKCCLTECLFCNLALWSFVHAPAAKKVCSSWVVRSKTKIFIVWFLW